MLEPAYQALIAQKQYTFLIRNEVFHNPGTMKRWKGNEIMRQCKRDNEAMRESYWKSAVERAGARHRRSYQTRFFGAIEMMISAGESPMWVAQQMGYSGWGMI